MFGIDSSEFLIIAVVALIAIGPKDLPAALRTAGRWVRKARMLTREFQHSVDEMIRQAELEELRDQAKKLAETNLSKEIENTIDPGGELQRSLSASIDPAAPVTPVEPAQTEHIDLVEAPKQGDLLAPPAPALIETPHQGDVLGRPDPEERKPPAAAGSGSH
jgi:sec-independent protein translocase protein TatB